MERSCAHARQHSEVGSGNKSELCPIPYAEAETHNGETAMLSKLKIALCAAIAVCGAATLALAGDSDNTRQTDGFSSPIGPLGQAFGTPPAPARAYAYGLASAGPAHRLAAKRNHAR